MPGVCQFDRYIAVPVHVCLTACQVSGEVLPPRQAASSNTSVPIHILHPHSSCVVWCASTFNVHMWQLTVLEQSLQKVLHSFRCVLRSRVSKQLVSWLRLYVAPKGGGAEHVSLCIHIHRLLSIRIFVLSASWPYQTLPNLIKPYQTLPNLTNLCNFRFTYWAISIIWYSRQSKSHLVLCGAHTSSR